MAEIPKACSSQFLLLVGLDTGSLSTFRVRISGVFQVSYCFRFGIVGFLKFLMTFCIWKRERTKPPQRRHTVWSGSVLASASRQSCPVVRCW